MKTMHELYKHISSAVVWAEKETDDGKIVFRHREIEHTWTKEKFYESMSYLSDLPAPRFKVGQYIIQNNKMEKIHAIKLFTHINETARWWYLGRWDNVIGNDEDCHLAEMTEAKEGFYTGDTGISHYLEGEPICLEMFKPFLDKNGKHVHGGDMVISNGFLFEMLPSSICHRAVIFRYNNAFTWHDIEVVTDLENRSDRTGLIMNRPFRTEDKHMIDISETIMDYSGNLYPIWEKDKFYQDSERGYISPADLIEHEELRDEFDLCEDCGAVICKDELTYVQGDDKVVCDDCLCDYCYCTECMEWYDPADGHDTSDGNWICSSCLYDSTEYHQCVDCGDVLPAQHIYEREDGKYVCEDCGDRHYWWNDNTNEYCFDEPEEFIRNYHDSPDYKFHSMETESYYPTSGEKYLGVELEIQKGGCDNDNAQTLLGDDERWFAMYDGSLDRGFEIISMPCTFDYHMSKMKWETLLPKAFEMGYRGCNGGGLHVHVSLDHFKDENSVGELVRFFDDNYEAICRFARRKTSDAMHWAGKCLDDEEVRPNSKGEWVEKQYDKGRYKAVNLQPSHTVEFRIFRSTLEVNHFHAVLQFVDIITDLANEIDEISFPAIRERAEERGCKELLFDMDKYQLV